MSSLKAMFDKFLDRLMAPSPTQELYHSEILPLIPGFDTPTIIPPTPVTAPVTVAPTALSVSSLPIKTHVTGATVAFVNHSSVVTDAQIVALVKALQIQVDRDFTPIWKISAQLVAVPTNATPAADAWVIAIMDTSDQAGALGYHDITSTGTPLGRVFAKDDIHYGLSWTVTVSHELLELLVDPWIANTVFFQNSNTTGMLYALEVCDPPENDSFGYEINGILVSDFVYPAWFEGFRTANSTQFDHCNLIHKPFELLSGGYIGVFPVNPQTKGWNQLLASGKPGARALRKSSFSRTRRRGVVPVHQDE